MDKNEKVLFINPPSDKLYYISIQPPLGILYLASYLRQNGIDVNIIDLNISRDWRKDLHSIMTAYKPTTVGLSSNFSNRYTTLKLASEVKAIDENIAVIVGGPQPTIEPSEYNHPSVDYIMQYEAEKAMLNLLKGGNGHRENPQQNGQKTPKIINVYDPVWELDTLPFPAYDMISVDKYYINSYKKRPLVSMVTSRGCPSHCIFCSQMVTGRKWRSRSPENIVDEMEWLEKSIGVKEISIEDDNFTYDVDRVFQICELKKKRGINLVWQLANGITVNKMTKELLQAIKDAGCWKIAIAPEVGDAESLKKIKKAAKIDQFRQAAKWCKELDIVFYGFFLIGLPFQTEKDMEQTVNFAFELDPLMMDLSKLVPFKGTEVYDKDPALSGRVQNSMTTYYDRQNNNFLERIHRNAYLRFYSRPHKIMEIINKIGMKSFLRFVKYGLEIFYAKG